MLMWLTLQVRKSTAMWQEDRVVGFVLCRPDSTGEKNPTGESKENVSHCAHYERRGGKNHLSHLQKKLWPFGLNHSGFDKAE